MSQFNSKKCILGIKENSAKSLVLILYFVVGLFVAWNKPAFAMGMGDAIVDSSIGQPISLYIPVSDVKDSNNFSVTLQPSDLTVNLIPLQARLIDLNSKLVIHVTSEKLVVDPYVSFIIQAIDGEDVSSKVFTILLGAEKSEQASRLLELSTQSDSVQSFVNRSVVDKEASIMGPYDWAQVGQVPNKFGPVLDGQSLWRVARRINQALGVSIDQMMWSLYQNNREHFSDNSIESLNAGTILTIPTVEQASQLTEAQATEKIKLLSRSNTVVSDLSTQTISQAVISSKGLDSDIKVSGVLDEPSPETIQSLTQEVERLTEKTRKKGEEFISLKEKLVTLERTINDISESIEQKSTVPIQSADNNGATIAEFDDRNQLDGILSEKGTESANDITIASSADDAVVVQVEAESIQSIENVDAITVELDDQNQLGDILSEKDTESANDISNITIVSDASDTAAVQSEANAAVDNLTAISRPVQVSSERESLWLTGKSWIFLGLLLLSVVAFLLRDHIVKLLNFGAPKELELTPSSFNYSDYSESEELIDMSTVLEDNSNIVRDEALVELVKPSGSESVMQLNNELSYTEMLSVADYQETDGKVTFFQRFEAAMLKQDFRFATQLLSFARIHELDAPQYNYHRLRLFSAMEDKNAFYKSYLAIENELPTYTMELQSKISQLVSNMK